MTGQRLARLLMQSPLLGLLAVGACAYRPPQSSFYCLEVPSGDVRTVRRVLDATANRLNFEVSENEFEHEKGDVRHVFEVYGKGVSLFVLNAMVTSKPLDEFENTQTRFDPKRYSVQAVKTGLWQGISFEEALSGLAVEARGSRLGWNRAPDAHACSTVES